MICNFPVPAAVLGVSGVALVLPLSHSSTLSSLTPYLHQSLLMNELTNGLALTT